MRASLRGVSGIGKFIGTGSGGRFLEAGGRRAGVAVGEDILEIESSDGCPVSEGYPGVRGTALLCSLHFATTLGVTGGWFTVCA